jgi:hypothetical protein
MERPEEAQMTVSGKERYKRSRPWWARNWKERILFCVVGLTAAAVTLLLLLYLVLDPIELEADACDH